MDWLDLDGSLRTHAYSYSEIDYCGCRVIVLTSESHRYFRWSLFTSPSRTWAASGGHWGDSRDEALGPRGESPGIRLLVCARNPWAIKTPSICPTENKYFGHGFLLRGGLIWLMILVNTRGRHVASLHRKDSSTASLFHLCLQLQMPLKEVAYGNVG